MRKAISFDHRPLVMVVLTGVAMTASAASFAGPGCMTNQQQARGFYPAGPMMPQAVYRPGPPAPYLAGPPRYSAMMAAPYPRPSLAPRGNPGNLARPAVQAPVYNQPATSGLYAASSSEPVGENITVRIDGMRFEPSDITVKPGTTVTWVHGSSMPHTVTGNSDELRSSTLYNGQQYSHTFESTGRYDYTCEFHPAMKGSVIVEASGTDT